MNGTEVRYVGYVQISADEVQPVYVSTTPHACNPCCRGAMHAELLYRQEPDAVTRALAQAAADLTAPGFVVLDVQPAPEAPLPDGYRTAWLVIYGYGPALRVQPAVDLAVAP
jgi:hypothetical protein